MENQTIRLREPIEWVQSQTGTLKWAGCTCGSPVAEIHRVLRNHFDIYILDGVRQVYAESLAQAKIAAESTLLDWLNSVAVSN